MISSPHYLQNPCQEFHSGDKSRFDIKMLTITTPSRLHLALIDMNASIGRVDGSIGITLDEPVIKISARKSDIVEITGNLKLQLSQPINMEFQISEHFERMIISAKALLPDGEGIRISIEKD